MASSANAPFLIIALTTSCSHIPKGLEASQEVRSDFESEQLDPMWKTRKLAPGSWQVQSSQKRSGDKALKLTLRQGDIGGVGEDGKRTERAELKEKEEYHAKFDQTHWYCFSFMVPKDFPEVSTRLIAGQWKQVGGRNPLLAQRFVGDGLDVSVSNLGGKQVIHSMDDSSFRRLRGQWIDVAYRVRFSHQAGVVDGWINGQEKVSYRGPLGYDDDEKSVYFKFGLYRDSATKPMSIYFDDYIHRRSDQPPEGCRL